MDRTVDLDDRSRVVPSPGLGDGIESLQEALVTVDVVYHADAVSSLTSLVKPATVDLAYVDPPFFTQKEQRGRNRHTGEVRTFDDRWNDIEGYRKWAQQLFTEMSWAIKDSGAVFVHCDWRTVHHLRLALDEVLGAENFRNEIIWHYRKWTNSRSSLQRIHQTILYYAKSELHRPVIPMMEYSPTTNLDQIWQARTRNDDNVAVYKVDDDDCSVSAGAKHGVPMGDVWDIPYLNPKARERVGYPTQKPLMLLERLVALACPPNGVVLDPCCGSGTTLVAAQLLGRHWIGIDVSPDAVALAQTRLLNPVRSESAVHNIGRDAFRRTDEDSVRDRTLQLLNAHVVHRNKYIDGYLSPTGLRSLGLPVEMSVMMRIVRQFESSDSLVDPLERLAVKKQCELVLLFTRDPTSVGTADSSSAPGQPLTLWGNTDRRELGNSRVAIIPAPETEAGIEAIRHYLQTRVASLTTQDGAGQTL